MNRRTWLKSAAILTGAFALLPLRALAALWNKPAFEATESETALAALNANQPQPSAQITIVAPDFAENGAIVQIEVESLIPGTEAIAVLGEKNPTPLIANFMFSNGAQPRLITRIKLAETGMLKVVVKAGNKYYEASKEVKVSLGGCG